MSTRRATQTRLAARQVLLVALWAAGAWLAARSRIDDAVARTLRDEAAQAERQLDAIVRDLTHATGHYQAIAAVLAEATPVRDAAEHAAELATDPRQGGGALAHRVDQLLAATARDARADLAWLLDGDGTCIASSNAGSPESLVGTSYRDREYFRESRNGQPGHQYTLGRKSGISGLVFSSPVRGERGVIGVVALRVRVSALSHVLEHGDGFVSDAFGVVIFARDRALELRALPGSAVAELSAAARLDRYGQSEFAPLPFTPAQGRTHPLLRFGPEREPVLLASRAVPWDGIDAHVVAHLASIDRLERSFPWLFGGLWAAGVALTLALDVVVLLVRARRRERRAPPPDAAVLALAPGGHPDVDEQWLGQLRDATGGDTDHLFDVYVATVTEQLRDLSRARAGRDARTVGAIAHSIKGASRNLGFTGMGARAERLEAGARQEPPDLAEAPFTALEQEFRRILGYVRRPGNGARAVL